MKRAVIAMGLVIAVVLPAGMGADRTSNVKFTSDADREFELTEKVMSHRAAYLEALGELHAFYVTTRQPDKAKRALAERNGLKGVPRYSYFVDVHGGPIIGAGKLKEVPAAEALYTEGVYFKDYPALPDTKKKWLEKALNNFREVLRRYPQSTRTSDAAFRMGEIYAGWYYKDYALAARYFEKCFRWNPATGFNARYRSAELYDRKLIDWRKAKGLYEECVANSPDPESKKKAQARLNDVARLQARR
jgi:tetratricopeptide (TPR) repeat protein